ncbi:MAG: DUF2971 domain-containing protein [Bacteroidetes bacterium]|nr:DUF2971 domain-containing protein [Bacteroidota bacterium]
MELKNNLLDVKEFPYVVRFLNLPKLLDLLISEKLYFSRLDSFKDKSEAISHQQLIKLLYPKIFFVSPKKEMDLEKRQRSYFATCWFGSKRESFAMWNLYSDSSSVAIKYKLRNFNKLWELNNIEFDCDSDWINRIFIDKMIYKDYLNEKEITKDTRHGIMGLYKDQSYSDEKEVRVLIKCKGRITQGKQKLTWEEQNVNAIKLALVNLKDVPFEILFHPEMKETHKRNIEDLVKKYNFQNVECKDSELSKLFISKK